VSDLLRKLGVDSHVCAAAAAGLHDLLLDAPSSRRFAALAAHLRLRSTLYQLAVTRGFNIVPLLQLLEAFVQIYPDVITAATGISSPIGPNGGGSFHQPPCPTEAGSAHAHGTGQHIHASNRVNLKPGCTPPPGIHPYNLECSGPRAVAELQQQLRWHTQRPRELSTIQPLVRRAFLAPRRHWRANRRYDWASPSRASERAIQHAKHHVWIFCKESLGLPAHRLPRRARRRSVRCLKIQRHKLRQRRLHRC
jgi:hypothetical protein